MTYYYRCAWCGSFRGKSAAVTREHVYKAHRSRLLIGLGPIEYYGTRDKENARLRAVTARPDANPGASGEGDSS